MSVKSDVEQLEQTREKELRRLCGRIETLTNTVEKGPVKWIGEHPYMALVGAAVSGFLTAQLASLERSRKKTVKTVERKVVIPVETPVREASVAEGGGEKLMEMLLMLAGQFLQAPPVEEKERGGVCVGDAGVAAGAEFPGGFSAPEVKDEAAVR